MPFTCETCRKSFSDRFSHLQHTCPQTERSKVRHTLLSQEEEFKKSQKEDLKNHERTHTEDKQFSCHHCDSSFRSLDNLKEHNKTHTCKFLLQNNCKFGSSGKNHNGVCSFAHPRLCIYFQAYGRCKKGDNCDFLHISNNRHSRTNARPVTRDYRQGSRGQGPSNDTAFLGESTILEYLDKYFHQRLQDMRNNNSRSTGPQWTNRR